MTAIQRRTLRANSTDAERALWLRLRDRRLAGAKFRRQVPFPPYTVDFCCFEAKLIIEVDGGQHNARVAADAQRTKRLEGDGFSVIRFWNNDVLTNMDGVLQMIIAELEARGAPFEPPSPEVAAKGRSARTPKRQRTMAARSSVPTPLVRAGGHSSAGGEGQGEGAPASKNATHRYKLRVYFEDTDAGGMVYYANYLKFAERARTEMLRAAGIDHARMVAEEGLMLVVRHCTADFRRSAKLDDELEVETRLSELAGASLSLAQTIRRDGESLVELAVSVACITRAGRPTRLPERLRAAIAIN